MGFNIILSSIIFRLLYFFKIILGCIIDLLGFFYFINVFGFEYDY